MSKPSSRNFAVLTHNISPDRASGSATRPSEKRLSEGAWCKQSKRFTKPKSISLLKQGGTLLSPVTAHARSIAHQEARVELERSADDLLNN